MTKPAGARRRAISVSGEGLIDERLMPGKSMPLVISPTIGGINLERWASRNRAQIENRLARYGAILFRGFEIDTASIFEQCVKTIAGELLEYHERSSPRSRISGNIYTSTDYPSERSIFLHNENSYQQSWPMKIFFCCATPALEGGETPIADCRNIFKLIDPSVRERFAQKKIRYVRNFGDAFGLPWETVFQTSDRSAVEKHCKQNDVQFEWREKNYLRTSAVRAAIAAHPRSGEMVWFNHCAFFHVSTLEASVCELLLSELTVEQLPANTYYGDGSTIESSVLEEIRAIYRRETVSFSWEKGDVLMLDNMLTAHGRAPFVGPRKILVGMAELFTLS